MSRTPVQVESTKNPYITKGISKSLLTPCRQVGLSRKRKTRTSASISFSPNTDNTPSSLDTTPLSSNLALNDAQESGSEISSENEKGNRRGRVSKRLIAEDEEFLTDSNLENFNKKRCFVSMEPMMSGEPGEGSKNDDTKIKNNSENKPKISHKKKTDINKPIGKDFGNTGEDFEENMSSKKFKGTKKIKPRQSKNINEESSDEEETITLNNLKILISDVKKTENKFDGYMQDMEDFDPTLVKNTEFKRNEAKETENHQPEADLINDKNFCHKQQSIEPERNRLVKETKHNTSEDRTSVMLAIVNDESLPKCTDAEQKTKKIKRCLSLKKSSEDFKNDAADYNIILKECSVNLDPSVSKCADGNDSKLFPRVSSTEVKDLDKQIKQKRKLIEELKQAEIYQKKHDLKELAALTSLWKTGCISALNDLLPQLKTHAPIDMATLLNNLNIPKEIVSVSQDGELI